MLSKRSSIPFLKEGILARFLDLEGPLDGSGRMEASIARLRGLQGDGQFVGPSESGELLGVIIGLLGDHQNGVLSGTDDFGDVIGAVGQADRDRKVGRGPEHFADGIGRRDMGRSRRPPFPPCSLGRKIVWPFLLASTVKVF